MKGSVVPDRLAWFALAIALAVAAEYAAVRNFGFVTYDDPVYVSANPHLAEGPGWAWTLDYGSNWHPLTWWSHMLDVRLFGLDPGAHHVVNVLLHVANAVLLLLLLTQLTGVLGRSAIVAALFALHPLNVENVVWITERKSLLSTLFLILTLIAWTSWIRRGGVWRYASALILFALGLMAKPMLVTLPLLLIALDVWPLRRAWRFVEKVPFAVLSAGSCAITLLAQSRSGAMQTLDTVALPARLLNATVSYVWYLVKAIAPTSLSVFYPHPATVGDSLVWPATGAMLVLVAISLFAMRRKAFLFGWLWYLTALLPVIGVVQVGLQAHADRYAYVPLIGIFVAVVWGLAELERRWMPSAAFVVIVVFGLAGMRQVQVWRDSLTLWEHARHLDGRNWMAWSSAGALHSMGGDYGTALRYYARALELRPSTPATLYNTGYALAAQHRFAEAVPYYERALTFDPESALYSANLALAYLNLGRRAEAVAASRQALTLQPRSRDALYVAALVGARTESYAEALEHYRQLQEVDPAAAIRLRPVLWR